MDQRNVSDAMYQTTFHIAPSHPCLPGHFPDHPVVPGVLLLEQVANGLRAWRDQRMVRVREAKFLAPLQPDESVELRLMQISGCVRFEMRRKDQLIARGIVEGAS